jgi:chromosomal replication initiation ATPase DnaA
MRIKLFRPLKSIETAVKDLQHRVDSVEDQIGSLRRYQASLRNSMVALRDCNMVSPQDEQPTLSGVPIGRTEVERIIRESGARWNLTPNEVRGNRKDHPRVEARREAAARLRMLGMSYPEIGIALGGLHHTTVMHALGKRDAA